jgi:hypothetical protein
MQFKHDTTDDMTIMSATQHFVIVEKPILPYVWHLGAGAHVLEEPSTPFRNPALADQLSALSQSSRFVIGVLWVAQVPLMKHMRLTTYNSYLTYDLIVRSELQC